MEKRIDWIDAIRGFGVLLVVIGHFFPGRQLEKYIYSFHMFLFFAISGFVFRSDGDIDSFFRKKTMQMLLPYTFWMLIVVTPMIISEGNLMNAVRTVFMIDSQIGWNRPLWFIPVLYITELLYACLKKYGWYADGICLLVCPLIWYLLKGRSPFLKIDIVPIALFFFSLGFVVRKVFYSHIFTQHRKVITAAALPILGMIHVFCGVYNNSRIVFTYSKFGSYSMCILAGICGVLFYFLLFQMCGSSRSLAFAGNYSMFTMCTQYCFFHMLSTISIGLTGYDVWNNRGTVKAILAGIILTYVISAVARCIVQLCQRYPRLRKLRRLLGV